MLQTVSTPNSTGTDPGAATLTATAPAAGLYMINVQKASAMSGNEFTQLVQGTVTETGPDAQSQHRNGMAGPPPQARPSPGET